MLKRVQVICSKLTPLHLSSRQFHVSHARILARIQTTRYENRPHLIASHLSGTLHTFGFGKLNRGFSNNTSDTGDNINESHNLFCVHLRGLPYSSKEQDIETVSEALHNPFTSNCVKCERKIHLQFFDPLKPVHCKVIRSRSGNAIAYFQSHNEAEEAMKRNKENIGKRYIELFCDDESSDIVKYELNNLFGVHLRGLPYSCKELDIEKVSEALRLLSWIGRNNSYFYCCSFSLHCSRSIARLFVRIRMCTPVMQSHTSNPMTKQKRQ